jgi:poly(A) polymerase
MIQGKKILLPIISDKGFLALSDIFLQHNVSLYCVGGCIRDSLLGFSPENTDIDLSVPLSPDKVIEILNLHLIDYLTIGLEFGTLTVFYLNKTYEITSFRQDIKTDGRYALVSYGVDMMLDAQRRDFTINALYYDSKGFLYDPFGVGLQDLSNNRVAFIGDADKRIKEDYLRILRYFRFLARFGIHSYDESIFENSNHYHDGLVKLSEHRIRNEFIKLIAYPYAYEVLKIILELKYDNILFKDLILNLSTFKSYVSVSNTKNYILSSLIVDTPLNIIKNNTLLTKQEKKKLYQFKALYDELSSALAIQDWLQIGFLYYSYPYDIWDDILKILKQDYCELSDKIDSIKELKFPPFLITGKDLLKQGYLQGKEISEKLSEQKKNFVQIFLKENLNFL